MDLYAKIYNYCERGSSGAFWAEPLNAVSNAAFILASIMAAILLVRRAREGHGPYLAEGLLTTLVFIVGIGSFLFHTYATRWASFADVAPIGLFMVAYLVYALRRFLGLPWVMVLVGLAAFVWSLKFASTLQCAHMGLLPVTDAATGRCLNGSIAYVPAFLALAITSAGLAAQRHKAAALIGGAALLFLLSLTARTLDFEVCGLTRIAGRQIGTHALWHILNGLMLYLLLRAAICHGAKPNPRV